jgi:hypothetical protein
MTRDEHLDWCKKRALEYAEVGDLNNALISMMSDLGKHDETENHARIHLTAILIMGGFLKTKQKVIDHINGFN